MKMLVDIIGQGESEVLEFKVLHGLPKKVQANRFYAKIASWVKDGVPSLAREYTGGTARPSPGIF
jgi:hypothetical protein